MPETDRPVCSGRLYVSNSIWRHHCWTMGFELSRIPSDSFPCCFCRLHSSSLWSSLVRRPFNLLSSCLCPNAMLYIAISWTVSTCSTCSLTNDLRYALHSRRGENFTYFLAHKMSFERGWTRVFISEKKNDNKDKTVHESQLLSDIWGCNCTEQLRTHS